ncbi:MAG TPA: VCBS repeat-containing protein [Candidatus Limnocylindrales bacterium]|nr:VCBS repeat-containing protein [Candidatus Limnocylindrales bacterium]
MTRRRPGAVVAGIAAIAVVGATAGAWLAATGSGPFAPSGPTTPRFVEETASAGIDQTYDGPLAYFAGGGAAVLDCNDDGRPDLYVAGGTNPAALYTNDSSVGGALRFERLASSTTDLTDVTGAYPLDVDGDGVTDLAVLRIGGNVLLRGTGDCGFEPANAALRLDGGDAPTMAFAATWEGSNALPTLAFGNYVNPAGTGPADKCVDDVLVRPAGAGSAAGYAAPLPLHPSWCTLSLLFSDWDGSGRRDLRVSNDRHYYLDGEEQLWRIEPGAPPRQYTAADGWVTVNVEGMGIASQDLTGDGLPEVFLTSQGSNRLQTLIDGSGTPAYRDIGLSRNVNAERPFTGGDTLPSTAWHPEFDDVNNDGWLDLFISKGNVKAQPDFALKDPSNLLLGQADGTFVERADAAGILDFDLGRGAALADFNLDGLQDLVEVHLASPVRIWRNVGAGTAAAPAALGGWLGIRVTDPASPNRDAIGGWLEVRAGERTIRRELTIGGGHGSGQLGWLHAGFGAATDAQVRVTWPDGETGPWMAAGGDRFIELRRGAPDPIAWQPPAR